MFPHSRIPRPAAVIAAVTAAAITAAACSDDPVGMKLRPVPVIGAATIGAGPHNVLSAVVSVRVTDADSVAVRFSPADAAPATADTTPAIAVAGDAAVVPVMGLVADTRYVMRAIAFGGDETRESGDLAITTGSPPVDLPRYVAGGSNPAEGFVLFAAGRYVVVIDNTGRVVWYRHFPNGAGLNVMAQPTGHYVLRPPTPESGDIEPWVELDALGNVVRTLACANGLQPRLHDMILEPDGSYWILCDETRTMDLRAEGGVAAARVTGTVIQHVAANGDLLFAWNPFDHFAITDLPLSERTGASVNWTHGNALDLDADGNLIVSWRSLGEITRIDGRTGAVIWRMGGQRNEFTFLDTPTPAFAQQHSARFGGPGELLLLDNLGDRGESRAERYLIHESSRTARLARSLTTVPGVVTEIGGSVQRGENGRTLVSYGTAGRVEEYDGLGQVVWKIAGHAGYVFRAQRIRSLYAPGVGTGR